MWGKESLNKRVGTGRIVKEQNGRKRSKELNWGKKKKKTTGTARSPARTRQHLLTQNLSASVWVRSSFWEFGLFHICAMGRTDLPINE